MKLLVVSQYFWPESFRINELVAQLAARGHEITVLTGKPNYPEGSVFPEFRAAPAKFARYGDSVDIVRVPVLARGKGKVRLALNYLSFALSGMILAPLLLRRRRFDAIFVCLLSPVTSVLPAIVMRRLRRIPSVLWVLDLWPHSLDAVGAVRSPMLLAIVDRLVRFIYRRNDLLLGQSRSFIPEIAKYLVDPSRAVYFPNWSDPPPQDEGQPAPEVPHRPDLFNVVFTGNVGEAQDFPAVLQAADLLKGDPVRWIIVGEGSKAAWVREEIVRLGLEDKVIMAGRYPPEQMASFYQHADALLVCLRGEPSFAKTIPAKLQAYLAAGRPILAMLDGEGADVVRAANAGSAVPAGDSGGLAGAVRQLLALAPAARQQLAQNGRDYSFREFNRARLIAQLESLLGALVTPGPMTKGANS